jgi:hypothetical protein
MRRLEKSCSKCGGGGPFQACKRNKDGLDTRCKACVNKQKSDRRKAQRADDTTAVRGFDRERNRQRMYGLSPADFRALLAAQGHGCAICGAPLKPAEEKDPNRHVDHCHLTGAVRGILCSGCNTGLGHFKDDPARLRKALTYLLSRLALVPRKAVA